MERRDIFLPGGKLFQIIAGSKQARRNIMFFGFRGQQHLQQCHKGGRRRRAGLLLLQLRQFFFTQRAGLTDGGEQALSGLAFREILRNPPRAGQFSRPIGHGGRDLKQRIILHQALAGDIDALGFTFPPSGKCPQNAQEPAV